MNGTLTISSLATVYPNNTSIHSVQITRALQCQLLLPYDIYLLQLGFQRVAVVGKLVQKWERDSCVYKRRNNTQNNTKTQNTQNRKQTYKKRKT
jgi:hypothetical protein